jgi:acyl carrier protein
MTPDEIRKTVLKCLGDVAPDADLASLKPDKDIREELDIDSMDFLNFVVALKDALGVEVPEADYDRIGTIDACVGYLAKRLGSKG